VDTGCLVVDRLFAWNTVGLTDVGDSNAR